MTPFAHYILHVASRARPLLSVEQRIARGEITPAARARVTHCPRGHEYTHANTYITAEHKRKCRTCEYARRNRRRKAKRAAERAA